MIVIAPLRAVTVEPFGGFLPPAPEAFQGPPAERFAQVTVRRGIPEMPDGRYPASVMATIPRGRALGMVTFNENEFVATGVPIQELIEAAYGIGMLGNRPRPFASIEGIPSWPERFDIDARMPRPIPRVSLEESQPLRAMLQTLLADRFQLAAHWEPRQKIVYELRRDGPLGPQLRSSAECPRGTCLPSCTAAAPSEPTSPPGTAPRVAAVRSQTCRDSGYMGGRSNGTRSHVMTGMTLQNFVGNLQLDVRRPVIDQTGLEGRYSLELRFWSPRQHDGAPVTVSAIPPNDEWRALSSALREQLGLRLEPRMVPEEVLVIDRIALPTYDSP